MLTRIGALLLVTFVLGLSCAKVNLRCGAMLFCHSSSSSAKDATVRSEMSRVDEAGYSSAKALERMRDTRKRASALESLVDSPGRVGRYPFSVMYSSSASTGYSQWTSSSLIIFGRPRCAADKLDELAVVKAAVGSLFLTNRRCTATRTLSSLFH